MNALVVTCPECERWTLEHFEAEEWLDPLAVCSWACDNCGAERRCRTEQDPSTLAWSHRPEEVAA